MTRLRSRRTLRTCVPIPPELTLGASMLDGFRRAGVLDRAAKGLGVSRRYGHGSAAVLSFFVASLLASATGSIVGFAKQYEGPVMQALAALAGFRSLPTASSVSRCLGSLTAANVHAFADAMLCGDPRTRDLLAQPCVRHRDAHGRGWHVLDLDPTVTAYRQRALPEGDDLPEPKRLAPGTRGYTGHHRGEVRTRLVPIRDSGAGLWLACRLIEGPESVLGALRELARVALAVLAPVDAVPHVILRMDGEFGSVGALRTCLEAGVVPLARLSRYGILDAPSVQDHLFAGTWTGVPGSGSGPRRAALDLGFLTLRPHEDAEGAEGGPVEVRVVVTRFARSSPGDRGTFRDGFQYELIATTMTADAWPAEHVAALYFGRAAIENGFAQEDHDFGTDRTFSYNAPGQAWVTIIAQLLANTLTLDAVDANPLSMRVAAQVLRPVSEPEPAAAGATAVAPPEAVETPEPAAMPDAGAPLERTSPPTKAEAQATVWGAVQRAFADIEREKGWSLDRPEQTVRCPAGHAAVASGFGKLRGNRRPSLYVRVAVEHCRECPVRLSCLRSTDPLKAKRLGRSVAPELVDHVQEAIDVVQRPDALRPLRSKDYEVKAPKGPPSPDLQRGPWVPDSPLFLPGTARRLAREAMRGESLVCRILPTGARPPRRHPLIAGSVAERQRRRQSWTERRQRWESLHIATLSKVRRR